MARFICRNGGRKLWDPRSQDPMPFELIAESLGVSLHRVYTDYKIALAKLRKHPWPTFEETNQNNSFYRVVINDEGRN